MSESHPDDLAKSETAGGEALARLLQSLSPDVDEAGRLYARLHGKLVGFFNSRGISDPATAADETLDRAASKITAGAPVPDVSRYCLGIARNIVKEKYRGAQRESSAFLKFIETIADYSNDQLERIYLILQPCFEELALDEQNLLWAYCQDIPGRGRADHRRRLAETMTTTVLALRMRVTRLRSSLADCVKRHLSDSSKY